MYSQHIYCHTTHRHTQEGRREGTSGIVQEQLYGLGTITVTHSSLCPDWLGEYICTKPRCGPRRGDRPQPRDPAPTNAHLCEGQQDHQGERFMRRNLVLLWTASITTAGGSLLVQWVSSVAEEPLNRTMDTPVIRSNLILSICLLL